VSATCPPDELAQAGTVCRASTDLCDAAEVCPGNSAACPGNANKPAMTVCRPAASACDAPELCTGTTRFCPPDILLSAGTICRPAVDGGCDVAETCTGTSGSCPNDLFVNAGTVCRATTGTCDPQEACTGSSNLCPANISQPTTNCEPYACTGAVGCRTTCITDAECGARPSSICQGGVCLTAKVVFVTGPTYANATSFGGLAGADMACQTQATNAGLAGTFKAWLSSAPGATTEAATRLTHATVPYVLRNKTRVAMNWTDLTDGTLLAPIGVTETGTTIPASAVWTGTTPAGAAAPSCSGWTTAAVNVANATTGSTAQITNGWTQPGGLALCRPNSGIRFYCFEQ